MNILLVTLIIAVAVNLVLFVPAVIYKSDKLTDLAYSLTFISIVLYTSIVSTPLDPSQILLVGMILLWALRLGVYLVVRIWRTGRDKRFDGKREQPLAFLQFWLLQAVAAWIILLPTTISLASEGRSGDASWQSIGLIIYAMGMYFETVADWQKFVFKQTKANRDKLIMSGLWRLSRHPNYFGEICVWIGVFVYCSSILRGWEWLSVVSPLLITYLLVYVSGIPPLEKKYREKYGKDKDYQLYRNRTNLLIPRLLK